MSPGSTSATASITTIPATADLQQVTVASAGSIGKAPNASIDFTPLLTSSSQSG